MLRYLIPILSALVLLCGCGEKESEPALTALSAPEYPQQAPYPDESEYIDEKGNFDSDGFSAAYDAWWSDQRQRGRSDSAALAAFTETAVPELLRGEGNRLCSPLNIYLALGMLAEITDGESRSQILALLQQPDMAALRAEADALWSAHYRDDGAATSRLAASVWLRQDMDYREEALQQLSEIYRAAAFRGTMGASETDEALQRWINENTGHLLTEQAAGVKLDEDTLLALVTTIYYNARWAQTFSSEATEPGIFHGVNGDADCSFMKRSSAMSYYWADAFAAVTLGLEEGRMELILPDEGSTPAQLLGDEEFWEFALRREDWERQKYLIVDLSLPRFDVAADMELGESLRALGIRDVFDPQLADFSPLSSAAAFLSKVHHAARVKADEEGVEAAAYTVMAVTGAAMPPEERVAFTLDRPFIFLLRGDDGAPLFVGVVETP